MCASVFFAGSFCAVQCNAAAIFPRAMLLKEKAMPLNNATEITETERALIGLWFKRDAKMPCGCCEAQAPNPL
jgi:uncharacterized membrane protein